MDLVQIRALASLGVCRGVVFFFFSHAAYGQTVLTVFNTNPCHIYEGKILIDSFGFIYYNVNTKQMAITGLREHHTVPICRTGSDHGTELNLLPSQACFMPGCSKSSIRCVEKLPVLPGQNWKAQRARRTHSIRKEDLKYTCHWPIATVSGSFQHKLAMDRFICAQWIWAYRRGSVRGFQEHS